MNNCQYLSVKPGESGTHGRILKGLAVVIIAFSQALFCDGAVITNYIDTTNKFAWSENSGWQNYRSTNDMAIVVKSDTNIYLSGYAWGENIGWVKLGEGVGPYVNTDTNNYGVNMDTNGNLAGYAWSENGGWVNFSPTNSMVTNRVTVNINTGSFDGYAWGENVGWINFKNVSPAYNVLIIQTAASVTLSNLTQNYNGSARVVTATVAPTGLMVNITYNGNSWAPTNSGTYAVTGMVNDVMYQGSATGTLNVIAFSVSPANFTNMLLSGFSITSQTFGVSAGGGNMSFAASVNAGATNWLSVSPTNGYSTGVVTNFLTNTYLTTNLAVGNYTGHVTVVSTDGGGATGVVSVALRVYSTPILNASPSYFSQVLDKGAANPTTDCFYVWNGSLEPVVGMAYRMVVNDAYNLIKVMIPSNEVSTGQHIATELYYNNLSGYSAGVYTALVAVVATNDGSGYEGYWSGTTNVNVVLVIAAPDAPSQITATKGNYEDRVGLNWRPVLSPAGGTVSYNVLRYTTFDSAYAQTIVSGLTVTNYDDMTASPGVRYYYWVKSVNRYDYPGTNSMPDHGYRRLAAPAGLFASDGEYTNKVAVSWAVVDGAGSYYLYRGAGGLVGGVYHTTGTDYDDNEVTEGVEYTYYVQATNAICGSVLSTGETGYVLSRPTVFSASDGQYAGKIRLNWNAVNGATAYEVWRSTQTLLPPYGGGAKITEMSGTTYDDAGVTAGTKYYYWLKSKNSTTLSAFSGREEGFSATAAVDLSLWGLVVQPRRIGVGGCPDVISFRLGNNGGSALTGDNGTMRLTFYSSPNAILGDGDDNEIGMVDERLELGIGSSGIFRVGGGNVVLPAAEGSYYLFMRLVPVWPSTLAPANGAGWVTQRAGALEISSLGSINYQAMNDYDGDGISDMTVHGGGLWDGRTVDGGEFARNYAFGGNGAVVMGDYDGDNKTDPVVYDESRAYWQALLSGSGYAYVSGWFGGPGYRGVPGDYDGDGKTEAAVYDTVNSLWYALKVGGGQVIWGMQFGNIGYDPVIGDYDGDGVWDLAVYNEASGMWYVRTVAGTLLVSGGHWGGPGFSAVPGDYDGDGLWDFAVYDEATGHWYIVNIRGEIIASAILWGAAGYRPVTGDFDGDGLYDLAMYNASAGKWFIRTVSGTWLVMDVSWGGAGYEAVGEVQ